MAHIRQNKWFTHAMKVGYVVGAEPDPKAIEEMTEIVGYPEAVITIHNMEQMAGLVRLDWAPEEEKECIAWSEARCGKMV